MFWGRELAAVRWGLLDGVMRNRLGWNSSRLRNAVSHLRCKDLERMRSSDAKPSFRSIVRVYIDRSLLAQFVLMLFHPLRGTKQPKLLAVPESNLDGAFRMPALLL